MNIQNLHCTKKNECPIQLLCSHNNKPECSGLVLQHQEMEIGRADHDKNV